MNKKMFRKIMSLVLVFTTLSAMLCLFPACSVNDGIDESKLRGAYTKELQGTTLNVFNWGENIADGSDGTLAINKAFEKLTGIKVNYTTYESNEALYGKIKEEAVSYDIIIPSDYMIERMIKEGLVKKINMENITNYQYIDEKYKGMFYDPNNEYSVPYTVGLVGIIYNTTMVEGTPDSWSIMWDEKYSGKILSFDNSRDAFGIAQCYLGLDVNSTNKADWDIAAEKLREQTPLLQQRVMDQIFQKMEGGNAAIGAYYAGDCLTMMDNNEDLEFFYPKEGTNIFVDAMCIPSNSKNTRAAEMYINFLLEEEVAVANSEYICYASPNTLVVNSEDYTLKDNEYLYPDDEIIEKAQYYHDIDPEVRKYFEDLFLDITLNK